MEVQSHFKFWQQAHHDYRVWDGAPNSQLFHENSMFDLIGQRDTVYLAHVTQSLEKIIEEGLVHPSAGCLVGSVYAVPVLEGSNGLRLHNLGAYYFLKEARFSKFGAKKSSSDEPDVLVMKVNRSSREITSLEGINYLRMGEVHFSGFNSLKHLAGKTFDDVKKQVVNGTYEAEPVLAKTVDLLNNAPTSSEIELKYLTSVNEALLGGKMPFFGYALFEAFTVCLMLFQIDDESKKLRSMGEFNNWNYKELIYRNIPDFKNSFSLGKFAPNWKGLFEEIEKERYLEIPIERFISLVALRARRYIAHNSLIDYFGFNGFKHPRRSGNAWDALSEQARPLLGHTAHRLVRNVEPDAYHDMFRWFEEAKAKSVWNYWNKKGVSFPFNGVIPKGEIGLNPVSGNIRVSFFRGVPKVKGTDVNIELGDKLDLKLGKHLGPLRHSFRRDLNGTQRFELEG